MENNTTIAVHGSNVSNKTYIVGKIWIRSKDGTRPGCVRINQDLPQNLTIHPGATLILHENIKRTGKMDADFSVSVILPAETANRLIAAQKRKFSVRPKEQLAAFAVD